MLFMSDDVALGLVQKERSGNGPLFSFGANTTRRQDKEPMSNPLWIPATIAAATFQVGRNALQRLRQSLRRIVEDTPGPQTTAMLLAQIRREKALRIQAQAEGLGTPSFGPERTDWDGSTPPPPGSSDTGSGSGSDLLNSDLLPLLLLGGGALLVLK
jgi:hypothetical protein